MKKIFLTVILTTAFIATSCMTVCAEAHVMADGEIFDAQYYAQNNPDVVTAIGTDENMLYFHYKFYGKAEGRQPHGIVGNAGSDNSVPVTAEEAQEIEEAQPQQSSQTNDWSTPMTQEEMDERNARAFDYSPDDPRYGVTYGSAEGLPDIVYDY